MGLKSDRGGGAGFSDVALVVVSGMCIFNLYSVLYLREVPSLLVPVLAFCVVFFVLKRVAFVGDGEIFFPAEYRIMLLILFVPGLAILGQAALNIDAVDLDGRRSIEFARSFWLMGVLWFLAGAALADARLPDSNALAFGIIGLLIALLWIGSEGFLVINYALLSAGLGGFRFSHLNTSDYTVFLLALAYGMSTKWWRFIVVVGALGVLFSLGGRSALFIFAASVIVHQLFYVRGIVGAKILSATVLVVIMVYVFVSAAESGLIDVAGKDLLFSRGYAADPSVLERIEQMRFGVDNLYLQIPFGDPSLIVERFSSVGAYMHNVLSVWQFYGFFFFAILVFSLVFCLRFSISFKSGDGSVLSVSFSVLLIYVCISVAISKSFTFYLMWLVLGYWFEKKASLRYRGSIKADFS